jgi:hypothetical protein
MYQLEGEELVRRASAFRAECPMEDAEAEASLNDLLTGQTRLFQGLEDLFIYLWPVERSPLDDQPLPCWVQARVAVAHTSQQVLHVFVALLIDRAMHANGEEPLMFYLLWNETQGVGTVLHAEDDDEEGEIEDIWAADLCAYLTVAFEEPGPADSPI